MSIYRSLLLVIAGATQKELARQVRYLKVENEILRSKLPQRITVTQKERQRLLKFGAKLGRAMQQLVTIVCHSTFLRWIREDKLNKKKGRKPGKRGRPRTREDIRKLVIMLAKENVWGFSRIVGELRKLRIFSVTPNTVKQILKAEGLDPCPKRSGATWDEFLERHRASIWQCDFFSKKVLTVKGFRELFVLVFLHVESRRVLVTPATDHPNEAWVVEQADWFAKEARKQDLRVSYVQRDRDCKYAGFDEVLKRHHVKIVKGPICRFTSRAFVESFIGNLKRECLNHFVFFGKTHLDSVVKTWVNFYLKSRPHQGVGNELLLKPKKERKKTAAKVHNETISLADIRCEKQLGGLLKSYSRKVA